MIDNRCNLLVFTAGQSFEANILAEESSFKVDVFNSSIGLVYSLLQVVCHSCDAQYTSAGSDNGFTVLFGTGMIDNNIIISRKIVGNLKACCCSSAV